jgi:hypothetical protein
VEMHFHFFIWYFRKYHAKFYSVLFGRIFELFQKYLFVNRHFFADLLELSSMEEQNSSFALSARLLLYFVSEFSLRSGRLGEAELDLTKAGSK